MATCKEGTERNYIPFSNSGEKLTPETQPKKHPPKEGGAFHFCFDFQFLLFILGEQLPYWKHRSIRIAFALLKNRVVKPPR